MKRILSVLVAGAFIAAFAGVAVSMDMNAIKRTDEQQKKLDAQQKKAADPANKATLGQMMNVNTTSKENLEKLPGIGTEEAPGHN